MTNNEIILINILINILKLMNKKSFHLELLYL